MSSYPSRTSPSIASNTLSSMTGVQRLNEDLANVFDRLVRLINRVDMLADQFGAPPNPAEPTDASRQIVTTNEHIGNIDKTLLRLETTLSRIDNQT